MGERVQTGRLILKFGEVRSSNDINYCW